MMINNFAPADLKKLNILKEKINNNLLPNQLIISSNNITKLNEFAKLLSMFLVCEKERTFDCDCANCVRIQNNTYYDLKAYGDFNTSIKKEEIQNIIEVFNYSALENKGVKIYIIKGGDLLTLEAANALLKFLEEPTDNTYAIILSNQRNRIIETIKSRCLNIILTNDFNAVKDESDDAKQKFVQAFFKNLVHQKNNNYILIRQLFDYTPINCYEYLSEIANVIKNNKWEQYNLDEKEILSLLKPIKHHIIEECSSACNLLGGSFNKELILEQAIIKINQVV
ncbi:DNA polymerase III subunit delta' [Spiroplasma mirum]|nr:MULTISPECIES: DNA polymerase III subunit delta' [Spiroplasma]AKM52621.1 DNA polymerase III subunit delta' [Spiroplasma atrichopogonis]